MYIHTSLNVRVEHMKTECAASIKKKVFVPSIVEHSGVARSL